MFGLLPDEMHRITEPHRLVMQAYAEARLGLGDA